MNKIFTLLFLLCVVSCSPVAQKEKQPENAARQLLNEMVDAMGGIENYRAIKDVTFTYNYRDLTNGNADISIEKYLYNGEWSRAEYHTHNKNIFPDKEGPVIQSWNGEEAWLMVEGGFVTDEFHLKMVDFSRKTAFFWFNMMYKMLDSGTIHKSLPNRKYEGKEYQIVEVTYEENIGDTQDRFVLYIDPVSKLVEHFLFSNTHFSKDAPPRMMHVEFQEVEGMKFPKRMYYESADWDGNIVEEQTPPPLPLPKDMRTPPPANLAQNSPPSKGPKKSEKIYSDIKINTGIDKSIFDRPSLE